MLAAAACQAVLFTLQRPLIVAHGAMVCVASISIIGMLCLAPWLPLALEQAARAPANALWAVAYLGVFSSAVGNATWGMTQATFGASRAANFLFLVPPVASAVAVFVTLEVPTLPTLLGGTIAIAGVLVVNSRAR